jgi:hypothetical protein
MDGDGGPLCPEHWAHVEREDAIAERAEWLGGEDEAGSFCTAADFLTVERESIDAYLASQDSETIFFGPGMDMIIGGPSDASKTLSEFDLCGKLADERESHWLGLTVCGELNVGIIVYPGEGEDEDVAERIRALIPATARDYVFVWDRWRGDGAPLADTEGINRLGHYAKVNELDVIALDVASSFARGRFDISKGLPEDFRSVLDEVRALSGRPIAFVLILHTRKLDRRASTPADELEEIAGTYARKVDSAIVIRKDGDSDRRRRVTYAKTRRGPKLPPVIAELPERGSGEAPRLTIVGSPGGIKAGTDADRMAEWIRNQDAPVASAAVRARFDISESTMRNRAAALEARGIRRGRAKWLGANTYAYGTEAQWIAKLGERLEGAEDGDVD